MNFGAGLASPALRNSDRLELWVGPEASYVRVGEGFTDQQVLSGFSLRAGDLERLASLGAGRVRFPLLWEREEQDHAWSSYALPRLQELGVAPILGLVHHGGGAVQEGILDGSFAEGLAAYAGRVATRFPWIDAYTPVNEPLTTARFSTLYGVWHPHESSDRAFVQALLAQLRGTVLSMRAIREVNPRAALIQTEDMGRVYGSPSLEEQVGFENLRRWLSFDLLCGRVDEGHGLWSYLMWAGTTPNEVLWFAEHPCPPDVLGLNVYPTSERFLDDQMANHPVQFHASNGRATYADVEAVRVRAELPGLFFERLMEAHERYGLAMALTEVHLGCTREEQLRWLNTGWQDGLRAREAGADVIAVTAWSAFGSYDWNSLLTRAEGHYEPGLWDVSGDLPRPTALFTLARELASGQRMTVQHRLGSFQHGALQHGAQNRLSHPALSGLGWWHREERVLTQPGQQIIARPVQGRALEVCAGPLARDLIRLCLRRGLPAYLHAPVEAGQLASSAVKEQPWARLQALTSESLNLEWLGHSALIVQGVSLTDRHLELALDLLIDGETGLWLWNGQAFAPTASQPLYGPCEHSRIVV